MKKRSKLTIFRELVLLLFLLFILGAGVVLVMYRAYVADLPSLASMSDYRPPGTPTITRVYDVNGKLIGEFSVERRIILDPDEIPVLLKNAIVAIEDERFYNHHGVDYQGIARAFWVNLKNFEFSQGGSTISMQIARTFFLTRERKLSRKIKEALLALRIEKNFSKDEILALYLNQIYLGHGTYGVAAAAEEYFGKKVGDLTIAECALLAGLPQKPSRLDPFRYLNDCLERRNMVLKKMHEQGRINDEEYKEAVEEKPKLVYRKDPTKTVAPYFTEYVRQYLVDQYGWDTVYKGGLTVFTTVNADWNAFAQEALRKGVRRQDRLMGYRGPTRFATQSERDEHFEKLVGTYKTKPKKGEVVEAMIVEVPKESARWAVLKIGAHAARLPEKEKKWIRKLNEQPHKKLKNVPAPTNDLKAGDFVKVLIKDTDDDGTLVVGLEQDPIVNGGLISLDPFTGEIRVMVGGYSFEQSEYNRAIQAKRQPGSSFKPFLYTAAIDAGYTPATVIVDTPIILQGPNGAWKPSNYGGKFSGPRTLASALQHSVNTISVRIAYDIGPDMIIKYARLAGITSELNRDLSLALGTASVTLFEMARAYGVFATDGKLVPSVAVRRVYNYDGEILEDRVPSVEGYSEPPTDMAEFMKWSREEKEPIWGQTGLAYRSEVAKMRGTQVFDPQTTYVMITLMRNVVEHGTGVHARIPGVEIAGKTGTTNKYRDALFIGYCTSLVTAVWVGHDKGALLLGHGATGGNVAAPIWQDYMYPVLKGRSIPPFPRPDGVVTYSFDLETGTLPCTDSKKIGQAAFIRGTAPRECPVTAPGDEGNLDIFEFDLGLPPQ